MAISKETADKLLTESYQEYYTLILALCKNRLREYRDYADDCVQKTFMFYYNKLLEGEEIINTKAYLYRIANNTCKAEYTSCIRREVKTTSIDAAAEVAVSHDDFDLEHAADIDYDEVAKQLFSNLNEDEMQLYLMKYVEHLPLEEIGDILGLKPNAVAKRVSRLRTRIKSLVAPALENYRNGG